LGSEDNVYVVVKVEVAESSINVWNLAVDTQCRLYGHAGVVVAVALLDLGDGVFLIRASAASACTKETGVGQQAVSVKK